MNNTFFLFYFLMLVNDVWAGMGFHLTLYAENEQFYLKSIPYTDNIDSNLGITYIYQTGETKPLYHINRYFNYAGNPNTIHLTNDGQTLFYVNLEKLEEKSPIRVYHKGNLTQTYEISDYTTCNDSVEDCLILYDNEEVRDPSLWEWKQDRYKIGFYAGTPESEKFAIEHNIFSKNDTIYLINQRKKLVLFDNKTGELLGKQNYNYLKLKILARDNKIVVKPLVNMPSSNKYPPLMDESVLFNQLIARDLGLKVVLNPYAPENKIYKRYIISINALLNKKGKLENIEIDNDSPVQTEKIKALIQNKTFNREKFSGLIEKWHINETMYFRNPSDSLAIAEKKQEEIEQEQEYKRLLTLDSINGFYIPQNLPECFTELDKLLKIKEKEHIKALSNSDATASYRRSLGQYLRNNWGLWQGSRLKKYFLDRGIWHEDDMSGIILRYYYDWLNGKTETWKAWEEEHKDFKW